jgi:hypothetical protein
MTESIASPMSRWRYGMHPHATEMRIRSLGRVYLQLGEALRLEMTNAGSDDGDVVHLQYYIATELGPWALWLSGAREDVAASEASLQELTPPFGEEVLTDAAKPNNKGAAWGLRR